MLRRLIVVLSTCAALTYGGKVQGQKTGTPTRYRLSLPDSTWALDANLSITNTSRGLNDPPAANAFFNPQDELKEDGEFQLLALQVPKPFEVGYLSIKLRAAIQQLDAPQLRTLILEELREKQTFKGAPKTMDHNLTPIARYTFWKHFDDGNRYTGSTPRAEAGFECQEAYFVNHDVWAITTLCAGQFDESEEKLFYSLIDNLKFVDTSAPSNSFDYYQKGRIAYYHKEYPRAVELLATALKLDDERQELARDSWRELVMDLADAYRRTRDREGTIRTLTYGIGKDPENTTFLMGLARFYALIGDEGKTLSVLSKWFPLAKKEKVSGVSDLNNDPAFTELMKVERFRKAVKDMRK